MTTTHHRRAVIVGAGLMGRWHADAVRRVGGTVTLIVDPNEAAGRALGARCRGAAVAAVLDPVEVARRADVAHVCSPVSTHAPVLQTLIASGIHALVEKPFAEDGDSTRTLLAQAAQRKVVLCPVHQFLFQDGVRKLTALLPRIGTVRRFEFSTCSAGAGIDPRSQDSLIAEILPHPLSLLGHLMGARLGEIQWQVAHPSPGEFRAIASVGPTVVDVAISAHGRPTENILRVVADGGTVRADLFHGFAVRFVPSVSRAAKIARPFVHAVKELSLAGSNLLARTARGESAYPGLRELVRAFHAAASSAGPPPISPDATLQVALARDVLIARMRQAH